MKKILNIDVKPFRNWDEYRYIELKETNKIDSKKPQLIFNINEKGETIVDSLHNKLAFDNLKDFKSDKFYTIESKYYVKAYQYAPEIFGVNNQYCLPEFLINGDEEACTWSICYNHLFAKEKRNIIKDNHHEYYKLGEGVDDIWLKYQVDDVQKQTQKEKAFPKNALVSAYSLAKYIGFCNNYSSFSVYDPFLYTVSGILYEYSQKTKRLTERSLKNDKN